MDPTHRSVTASYASLAAAALMLGACATVSSAGCAGQRLTETKLFFGLSKPDGSLVSEREWQGFVRATLGARFAEGWTILSGQGGFRNDAGRTITEPSRVVVRLHGGKPEDEAAIAAVIQAYKQAFRQESVLRTDAPSCASF